MLIVRCMKLLAWQGQQSSNSETFESLNGGLELTLQSFVFNWIQNLILSSIYHFNGYIIAKVWPCWWGYILILMRATSVGMLMYMKWTSQVKRDVFLVVFVVALLPGRVVKINSQNDFWLSYLLLGRTYGQTMWWEPHDWSFWQVEATTTMLDVITILVHGLYMSNISTMLPPLP
jgi:hypothetical protein